MPHPEPVAMAGVIGETAYAKVNVALHVRARRDDGYHALESLFVFAEDGDELTARLRDDATIALTIDGPFGGGLDAGSENLVLRAAHLLREHLGERRGADLHLTKNLPVASGIGGGSADAAATLRLLLRLWDAQIDEAALTDIALTIGSDVPACLASVSQMVAGRGEHLARHAVDGLEGAPMLLVNPGVGVSTGSVFAGWDRQDRGALNADSLDALIRLGRNDLETPAFRCAPIIGDVLAVMNDQPGLTLARMSGSGATCFALFEDAIALSAAAQAIGTAHPDWWVMETRVRGG
jgi:4-diphosphocytidyl-2-C-methyl-D-erythritol kinase